MISALYRRRTLLLRVAALALLVAGALLIARWSSSPSAPAQWVGFNDVSIGYRLANAQQDAELSARARAGVSRITIDWRWIEPERGRYDWRPYDALISALRARGIRPLLAIVFAPHWAWAPGIECNQYKEGCTYPPGLAHDADWRAFVASVLRRYPDAVAVEVWNEPNLAGFWRPRPDAARYAHLLRQAARAVRSVAPSVPVLLGGLAPVEPSSGAGVAPAVFLTAIYAHGGRGWFDGIGLHLYPCSSSTTALTSSMNWVRGPHGLPDSVPLWITELGVSTSGSPPCGGRSESEQAEILGSTYAQLRAMRDVRAVIVHTLIDRPGAVGDRESGFGVFRRDFSPRPAACVFAPTGDCALGEGRY